MLMSVKLPKSPKLPKPTFNQLKLYTLLQLSTQPQSKQSHILLLPTQPVLSTPPQSRQYHMLPQLIQPVPSTQALPQSSMKLCHIQAQLIQLDTQLDMLQPQ
jgi:hypothetical protein